MNNKVKDINKKTHILFLDDIINIRGFDPNNILIYCISYVTIKNSKYAKVNSVNPLYLMLNKLKRYFGEINGNKYLLLVPTNESK